MQTPVLSLAAAAAAVKAAAAAMRSQAAVSQFDCTLDGTLKVSISWIFCAFSSSYMA
jgi:hypothetical protein